MIHRAAVVRDYSLIPRSRKSLPSAKYSRLCFETKSEARLRLIVHGCGARVPSHVPGGRVPEQNRARLQGCDLAEQTKHAAPFCAFPGHVRLHKKKVGKDRAKAAERRDETELPNSLSKIEIEFDAAKMFLSMNGGEFTFSRQFCGPEDEHDYQRW